MTFPTFIELRLCRRSINLALFAETLETLMFSARILPCWLRPKRSLMRINAVFMTFSLFPALFFLLMFASRIAVASDVVTATPLSYDPASVTFTAALNFISGDDASIIVQMHTNTNGEGWGEAFNPTTNGHDFYIVNGGNSTALVNISSGTFQYQIAEVYHGTLLETGAFSVPSISPTASPSNDKCPSGCKGPAQAMEIVQTHPPRHLKSQYFILMVLYNFRKWT